MLHETHFIYVYVCVIVCITCVYYTHTYVGLGELNPILLNINAKRAGKGSPSITSMTNLV